MVLIADAVVTFEQGLHLIVFLSAPGAGVTQECIGEARALMVLGETRYDVLVPAGVHHSHITKI